ncbi:NEAT_domain-containing leucine-rich repeat protein [Hexamita inflata]|uniref:NEAT domain-containing leucine-rich repeat protein n=1 Tax=Hexamita inflata TaxID=28002 RepID=A0AA86UKZ8_9EUKA|nr:NEAT domain-containing leucine-rich repeat protein [Hexamita inflata]CAI9943528.1 NEAT domain-containing leucine-rich repeat protein [Hexamita inflata]
MLCQNQNVLCVNQQVCVESYQVQTLQQDSYIVRPANNRLARVSALNVPESCMSLALFKLQIQLNQLRHLQNLQSLSLETGQITFSGPAQQTLTSVWLQKCKYAFNGYYPNIVCLCVMGCGIQDVSFVSQFPMLQKLFLRENSIRDVSCISKLKELTYLDLSQNKIVDVSSFSNLRKLQTLVLNKNLVEKIEFVDYLQLECLQLAHNKISDTNQLLFLKNQQLTTLMLFENEVEKKIHFAEKLHFVSTPNTELYVTVNPVHTDINPFKNCIYSIIGAGSKLKQYILRYEFLIGQKKLTKWQKIAKMSKNAVLAEFAETVFKKCDLLVQGTE